MQPRREKSFPTAVSHQPAGVALAVHSPKAYEEFQLQYIKGANEHVTVMIQIETQDGVKNVEEIAAVDGISQYGIWFIMSLN